MIMALTLIWHDMDIVTHQNSKCIWHLSCPTKEQRENEKRNLSNWKPTDASLPGPGNLQMSVAEIPDFKCRLAQWFYSCLSRECWSTDAGRRKNFRDWIDEISLAIYHACGYGMCSVRRRRCRRCKEGSVDCISIACCLWNAGRV